MTADVVVTSTTYLQYYISMGCADTGQCYGKGSFVLKRKRKQITSLLDEFIENQS